MTDRLADRQARLLAYLTSGDAIFTGSAPNDPALRGIDPALLHLEARFSYDKRIEKIAAVFPRTFELLDLDTILSRFVTAAPPSDVSRLGNARQFYEFLSAEWDRCRPEPPYLVDIAACELACAQVRAATDEHSFESGPAKPGPRVDAFRRHPAVALLTCGYDVRPIFEEGPAASAPVRRDTLLAVTLDRDTGQPVICELQPGLFDLLAALDEWTDAADLTSLPAHLLDDLVRHGLVETRE
ncbi:MAG TPA: hypothetical protein VHA77_00810 [Xanthobacteraceae bacterium]|nr:hypothetical protein [Xanthobacteraceae bacterium]